MKRQVANFCWTGAGLLLWAMCAAFSAAHGADLTGAWATDKDACDRVFVRKGNAIAFREGSSLHGGGFIVEGRRLRGPTAKCTISRTKEDKGMVHMIAACATDIMLSNVQFSLKVEDDGNKVTRIFPGVEGLELTYHRCTFR